MGLQPENNVLSFYSHPVQWRKVDERGRKEQYVKLNITVELLVSNDGAEEWKDVMPNRSRGQMLQLLLLYI